MYAYKLYGGHPENHYFIWRTQDEMSADLFEFIPILASNHGNSKKCLFKPVC